MDINQVHDFLLDKYKVSRLTGRNSDKNMSIKNQLKPMVWTDGTKYESYIKAYISRSHSYKIIADDDAFIVKRFCYQDNESETCTGFKTIESAEQFIIDDHCKQVCKEVQSIDPFSTLHFYRYRNYNHRFVAHGKGRHYYTNLSVTNRYHIETVNSGEASVIHDVEFDSLADAQAWCQQDYDKYYNELGDAEPNTLLYNC